MSILGIVSNRRDMLESISIFIGQKLAILVVFKNFLDIFRLGECGNIT